MAVPNLQDAIDHLHEKNVDAAITALERKIEELPAHLTAHVLLARSYETDHQWQKALKHWEHACFLMPNSPVAQEGKARVLHRKDVDETATEIETASPAHTVDQTEPPTPDNHSAEEGADSTESTADEAAPPSDLEELRRQTDAEARTSGGDPGHPDAEATDPGRSPLERIEQFEKLEGGHDEDLDRLIDELESARIEPDPDVEDVPPPNLDDDVDDLVSETLARIHEAQDQYRKAAHIYVKLASQEPEDARKYLKKASEMRERAEARA